MSTSPYAHIRDVPFEQVNPNLAFSPSYWVSYINLFTAELPRNPKKFEYSIPEEWLKASYMECMRNCIHTLAQRINHDIKGPWVVIELGSETHFLDGEPMQVFYAKVAEIKQ